MLVESLVRKCGYRLIHMQSGNLVPIMVGGMTGLFLSYSQTRVFLIAWLKSFIQIQSFPKNIHTPSEKNYEKKLP